MLVFELLGEPVIVEELDWLRETLGDKELVGDVGGLKDGPDILVTVGLTERLCVRVIELVWQWVTLIDPVVVGQEVGVLEPGAVLVAVLVIRELELRSKEPVIVFDTIVVFELNLLDEDVGQAVLVLDLIPLVV